METNIVVLENSDFMFQITSQRFKNLKSQNATSSWGDTRKNCMISRKQIGFKINE